MDPIVEKMIAQAEDANHRGDHGAASPFSFVEFDAGYYWDEGRERFVDATYMVPSLGGLEMEEIASLLAERVERNHPGKGREAFQSATMQILNKDFNGDWINLMNKMKRHEMWGGPVPAALILPNYDDPEEFDLVIPDKNGVPQRYGVREHSLQDVMEVRPGENAVRGKFSWETKPPSRKE